jgi:hypothetical protein
MSGICAHRSMLRARNIWLLWPWRSQAINWPTQSTTRLSLDSPLDGFARYMLRRLRRIHALECSSYLLGRALLFKRGKRDPPDNASPAKLDAAVKHGKVIAEDPLSGYPLDLSAPAFQLTRCSVFTLHGRKGRR